MLVAAFAVRGLFPLSQRVTVSTVYDCLTIIYMLRI